MDAQPERTGWRRFLFGTGRPGEGLDATWWATGVVICGFAGIGGLVTGTPEAAILLIPGVWSLVMLVRRLRAGE
jgi:hypothetical protein